MASLTSSENVNLNLTQMIATLKVNLEIIQDQLSQREDITMTLENQTQNYKKELENLNRMFQENSQGI